MAKAARAARAGILSFASLVTPNIRELIAMSHALASLETSDDAFTQSLASCDSVPLPEIEEHVRVLMARGGVSEVVVKLGARGALAAIMSGALLLFHPRGS
jgi:fructose-1-phosphate kinase PfkB-like protein